MVLSLDFELYWGMTDKVSLEEYGPRVRGVWDAIPRILEIFNEYNIHATWGTIGMLMNNGRSELLRGLPEENLRPVYADQKISSYEYLKHAALGENENDDPYHFGPSLVRLIKQTPNQEIASHTFSHYYCIDGSKNDDTIFDADCKAFKRVAAQFDVMPTSIIFPRNQAHHSALTVCKKHGIIAYRGNEDHVFYRARRSSAQSLILRGFRLIDHYINLSGHHSYTHASMHEDILTNVRASRFLRPYNKTLRMFEPLHMQRIKMSMIHTAKRGEIFHLWWHPHNFGINTEENMKNLKLLLEHYKVLKERYGMESRTIAETATMLDPGSNELT